MDNWVCCEVLELHGAFWCCRMGPVEKDQWVGEFSISVVL